MPDSLREFLTGALHGKPDYTDPVVVLENLTVEHAIAKPHADLASIWEQLAHCIFWQDHSLELIHGIKPPYPENASDSWPPVPASAIEDQWQELITQFKAGLTAATEIANKEDLDVKIKAKDNATVLQELLVIVAHNAYHMGQIVTLRRMLGLWPPPSGGMTW